MKLEIISNKDDAKMESQNTIIQIGNIQSLLNNYVTSHEINNSFTNVANELGNIKTAINSLVTSTSFNMFTNNNSNIISSIQSDINCIKHDIRDVVNDSKIEAIKKSQELFVINHEINSSINELNSLSDQNHNLSNENKTLSCSIKNNYDDQNEKYELLINRMVKLDMKYVESNKNELIFKKINNLEEQLNNLKVENNQLMIENIELNQKLNK